MLHHRIKRIHETHTNIFLEKGYHLDAKNTPKRAESVECMGVCKFSGFRLIRLHQCLSLMFQSSTIKSVIPKDKQI